ncbi:MAG: Hydratase/decarboxylase [Variovorax sp.]|jgi:2-keto-4-pentenoate hydratase|nr:Hydratase/decarboxylase [Variovorax sp.]
MTDPRSFSTDALARHMLDVRASRATCPALIASHPGFSMEDAYAVAGAIAALRTAAGERRVGRKIGLTQKAGWAALGTDAPIWGHVYDTTLKRTAGGAARVDLGTALAPRIEPEIGFCLRTALDPAKLDYESLLDAIEWVAPCFEVIDSHFEDWKFKASEAVADFGVHYALIVGAPLRLHATERNTLADRLADCEVELALDGNVVQTGRGANTLGHPLAALAALAKVLAGQPDQPALEPGEIITTGTLTAAQPMAPGQTWSMRVKGLELAELNLAT